MWDKTKYGTSIQHYVRQHLTWRIRTKIKIKKGYEDGKWNNKTMLFSNNVISM